MAPKAADDVTSGITKLSLLTKELDAPASAAARPRPQKKSSSPVADNWEDEADDDDDDDNGPPSEPAADTPVGTTGPAGTAAPPPTPMSPIGGKQGFSPSVLTGPGGFSLPPFDGSGDSPQSAAGGAGPSRRPEKTDAVARRMIASALGMKAPRMTEEQRAYDRAVREKERKRREQEKEQERKREEEIAKARQAIWGD